MNYEAAILYAQQRMREIGKTPDQYHFEPVLVFPSESEEMAGQFIRSAYNEIYILVHQKIYFGLFILADNSAFNTEVPSKSGVPEFTGQIIFLKIRDTWNFTPDLPKAVPVEFLRVVIY